MVEAVDPRPGDVFLEIGPGTGALTRPLASRAVPIVAVELDSRLASDLARDAPRNVTVWAGDILDLNVVPLVLGLQPHGPPDAAAPAQRPRFRVVGNLPYYIASPILFRLIALHREHRLFEDATVMVQKEVADRLLARPRTKAYGVLTILVSLHAEVTRCLDLPPGAFQPQPKVHSTVVRLRFRPPPARVVDERLFEQVVKAMFTKRRKTLSNALKGVTETSELALRAASIDPRRRPETLSFEEIARLVEVIATAKPNGVL